jgi:hypothetical protein
MVTTNIILRKNEKEKENQEQKMKMVACFKKLP